MLYEKQCTCACCLPVHRFLGDRGKKKMVHNCSWDYLEKTHSVWFEDLFYSKACMLVVVVFYCRCRATGLFPDTPSWNEAWSVTHGVPWRAQRFPSSLLLNKFEDSLSIGPNPKALSWHLKAPHSPRSGLHLQFWLHLYKTLSWVPTFSWTAIPIPFYRLDSYACVKAQFYLSLLQEGFQHSQPSSSLPPLHSWCSCCLYWCFVIDSIFISRACFSSSSINSSRTETVPDTSRHDLVLLRKKKILWINCFVISVVAFADCSLNSVEWWGWHRPGFWPWTAPSSSVTFGWSSVYQSN